VTTSRIIPLRVLTQTTNSIVGITRTVSQVSGILNRKEINFDFYVADIAICYKWWLRCFSSHRLGQEQTRESVFLFGSWHPFKQALKILWQRGFFFPVVTLFIRLTESCCFYLSILLHKTPVFVHLPQGQVVSLPFTSHFGSLLLQPV